MLQKPQLAERQPHPNALTEEVLMRILGAPEVAAPKLARALGLNAETVRRVRRLETKGAQEAWAKMNGEYREAVKIDALAGDEEALRALTPDVTEGDIQASLQRMLAVQAGVEKKGEGV